MVQTADVGNLAATHGNRIVKMKGRVTVMLVRVQIQSAIKSVQL